MRRTISRWESKPVALKRVRTTSPNDAAVLEGRTRYPSTVREPSRNFADQWCLKEGVNNPKIGGLILKGPLKGFPVYTLTLEERSTCPRSCHHWSDCYGNNMQWPDRIKHGPNLEWRLPREVALLSIEHPDGFAVRLHVLGDFYSVPYVNLWRTLLEAFPSLHVFGMTARIDTHDPIATAVLRLRQDHPVRFNMRFSNAPAAFPAPRTVSIKTEADRPHDAIVCPQQLGKLSDATQSKTESCSACTLFFTTPDPIGFLPH